MENQRSTLLPFNSLRILSVLALQGNAHLGPWISESEVQNALDFCASLFNLSNQGVANGLRKHHLKGLESALWLALSGRGITWCGVLDKTGVRLARAHAG